MPEERSRIAFGPEANIDAAIEQGLIDPFDILFLNEKKIGWIDENGNKIVTGEKDYNENDPSASGYIKNRPFYTEGGYTVAETIFEEVLDGTSVEPTPHGGKQFAFEAPLIGGTWYRITLDGKVYDVCCEKVTGEDLGAYENIHFLGNIGYMNQLMIDADVDLHFTNEATNEPFVATYHLIGTQGGGAIQIGYSADSYNVSIQKLEGSPEVIHKLDPKYYERLAWEEGTDEVVLDQDFVFTEGSVEAIIADAFLVAGDKYNVKIGDNSWDVTAYSTTYGDVSLVMLGNQRIAFGDAGTVDLDKPFLVGYGHIEGEHFLSVMAVDPAAFPNEEIPLGGEYRITITHSDTTIKKIDERFLPDSVPTTPDYEQNNYLARDYIKNRPFYSGILSTTAAEAIARGAPVYDIMPENPGVLFVVKICDYVPFNDDMRSARFWGASVDEGYEIEVLDYGWSITDNDSTPLVAIKDIDLFNESFNEYEPFEEPGVYMFYATGYESAYAIELPIKKESSSENIKISWENIKNAPFGKTSGRRIVGCEYNTDGAHHYVKENSSTWTEEATFHRFCAYYFTADEMIGCTLLLSDGSTLVVTDDSFLYKNSEPGFWEIENLIFSSKEANPHEESGTYLYHAGGGMSIAGTFTSDATGVYVKEIIFPDEIKKVEPELLPEGLASEDYVDESMAQAKEYTDSQRLGYTEHRMLTFDGTLDDMTSINNGIYIAKLSDEVIDLKSVKKIALKFNPDSPLEELDVTSDNSRVEDVGGGHVILYGQYSGSEFPALRTMENPDTATSGVGTYVMGYDTETVHGWVSRVDLHTIHQIPVEYIPATGITDEEADALIASII